MGAQLADEKMGEGDNEAKDAVADFETAIEVAGFGVFNILLLLAALPASTSAIFETSSMSYIVPVAECDLDLTLLDKGILNAITYAGMITSAVAWGYISDTKGRKWILVFGYLADGICVIGSSMSQNVIQLMIFKYFGGFMACGPFAVLMTYITELHGKKYRAGVLMGLGMTLPLGSFLLPALATLILPQHWNFQLIGLTFVSWQIFLAISAIPSILSAMCLVFFPESPKFLMSQGRNAEALECFQTIYAINKHKPKETYPIKKLIDEVPEKQKQNNDADAAATIATIETWEPVKSKGTKVSFRDGLLQLRPLFTKPYLSLSLKVYLINFCILLVQNTMRLWLPQLFASMTEFENVSNGEPASICTILEYNLNKTSVISNSDCEVVITAATYTNNFIVSTVTLCGYLVAGSLVNLVGGKYILIASLLMASSSGISLYWSGSSLSTLIISAIFVSLGSISSTLVLNTSVNSFPTSLRTMIVSLSMMVGRSGSIIGNIVFPMFISLGCFPPFLLLSTGFFIASILAIFLPNTKKVPLK